MEFNQTLMARRSLRAYEEGKTVEKAQLEELIRFAQMAPSWKNSQTGRYYVVMSPEMLEKVKKDFTIATLCDIIKIVICKGVRL